MKPEVRDDLRGWRKVQKLTYQGKITMANAELFKDEPANVYRKMSVAPSKVDAKPVGRAKVPKRQIDQDSADPMVRKHSVDPSEPMKRKPGKISTKAYEQAVKQTSGGLDNRGYVHDEQKGPVKKGGVISRISAYEDQSKIERERAMNKKQLEPISPRSRSPSPHVMEAKSKYEVVKRKSPTPMQGEARRPPPKRLVFDDKGGSPQPSSTPHKHMSPQSNSRPTSPQIIDHPVSIPKIPPPAPVEKRSSVEKSPRNESPRPRPTVEKASLPSADTTQATAVKPASSLGGGWI